VRHNSELTLLPLSVIAMYGIERRWPTIGVALVVGLATASRPLAVAFLAPLALATWRRHAGVARRLCRLAVWLGAGYVAARAAARRESL